MRSRSVFISAAVWSLWIVASTLVSSPLGAAPVPQAALDRIRFWSNSDYTRVVIATDRPVRFTQDELGRPRRIYFDLENARLSAGIEKQYQVNGPLLTRIRIGKNRPGVIRVVLDLGTSEGQFNIFTLQNPFRIVLDTRSEEVARTQPDVIRALESFPVAPTAGSNLRAAASATPTEDSDAPGYTRVLGLKVGRVAIDPGHGGRDTGTLGPGGVLEKDVVLDISLKLKDLLVQRLDVPVVLTRLDDTYVPLERRTAIANQHSADLLVSIHANGSRHESVGGIETFFLSFSSGREEREVALRENSDSRRSVNELEDLLRKIAVGEFTNESKAFATLVQKNLVERARKRHPLVQDRGIRRAPFIVLINAKMPSILTEIGFLSNRSDSEFLATAEGRKQIAEALYDGIEQYFRTLQGPSVPSRTAPAQ